MYQREIRRLNWLLGRSGAGGTRNDRKISFGSSTSDFSYSEDLKTSCPRSWSSNHSVSENFIKVCRASLEQERIYNIGFHHSYLLSSSCFWLAASNRRQILQNFWKIAFSFRILWQKATVDITPCAAQWKASVPHRPTCAASSNIAKRKWNSSSYYYYYNLKLRQIIILASIAFLFNTAVHFL